MTTLHLTRHASARIRLCQKKKADKYNEIICRVAVLTLQITQQVYHKQLNLNIHLNTDKQDLIKNRNCKLI